MMGGYYFSLVVIYGGGCMETITSLYIMWVRMYVWFELGWRRKGFKCIIHDGMSWIYRVRRVSLCQFSPAQSNLITINAGKKWKHYRKFAVKKLLEVLLSFFVFGIIETQHWRFLIRTYPQKIGIDHFSSLWPSCQNGSWIGFPWRWCEERSDYGHTYFDALFYCMRLTYTIYSLNCVLFQILSDFTS